MKRSTNRILTTHAGSLPRPPELLEMIRARETGRPYDQRALDAAVRATVHDYVRRQAESKVDIVTDGEVSKSAFVFYTRNRLSGYDRMNTSAQAGFARLFDDFPDYNAWRAEQFAGGVAHIAGPPGVPECVGPIVYKGQEELQKDIDNLKAALQGVPVEEAFMPAASIGIVAQRLFNAYYPTYEAYVEAITNAMRVEYEAIAAAGLILQIDAPEMVMDRNSADFIDKPLSEYRKRMGLWVEALNTALANIPEDRIRFHICWGNQEAPHTRDVPLEDIVDIMLQVRAEAYSVEASNPRHGHEWAVWQDTRLPDGKILIPGVLDSTTNFVEHPELVAQRILSYARLVGRENVIAGTDCGFATMAFRQYAVHTPIVWAKLAAMAEGAEIATKELWK